MGRGVGPLRGGGGFGAELFARGGKGGDAELGTWCVGGRGVHFCDQRKRWV